MLVGHDHKPEGRRLPSTSGSDVCRTHIISIHAVIVLLQHLEVITAQLYSNSLYVLP